MAILVEARRVSLDAERVVYEITEPPDGGRLVLDAVTGDPLGPDGEVLTELPWHQSRIWVKLRRRRAWLRGEDVLVTWNTANREEWPAGIGWAS